MTHGGLHDGSPSRCLPCVIGLIVGRASTRPKLHHGSMSQTARTHSAFRELICAQSPKGLTTEAWAAGVLTRAHSSARLARRRRTRRRGGNGRWARKPSDSMNSPRMRNHGCEAPPPEHRGPMDQRPESSRRARSRSCRSLSAGSLLASSRVRAKPGRARGNVLTGVASSREHRGREADAHAR